jgi:DNA-binding MarR family transcriptional regulator
VHDTHELDTLTSGLLDLVGFLNSPRQDDVLLRAAGVSLDRALFPLLVRIGAAGSIGVVELADHVGRDHSTISRQVAKLETAKLVLRQPSAKDQRVHQACITQKGKTIVRAITRARHRLLNELLKDWSKQEVRNIARLSRKLADTLKMAQPR